MFCLLMVGHVLLTNCGSCFVSEYRRGCEVLTADLVLITNSRSCFVSEYRRGGEVLHVADRGLCFVY